MELQIPIPPAQKSPDVTNTPESARQSLQNLAHALPDQYQSAIHQAPQQLVPAYNNIYTEICTEILKQQRKIIGIDLALEQVQGIEGLSVDASTLHCTVLGDGSKVINDLIQRYSTFFGGAAVEVCRDAASRFLADLSPEQIPALLATPRLPSCRKNTTNLNLS